MADGTGVVFDDVAEHFTGNFDESCFMLNQDGSIKIVASVIKKKIKNNCDNLCASIIILRGEKSFLEIKDLSFLYQK